MPTLIELQAENEALKAKLAARPAPKLTLKVSMKRAVSLYGMGRFPVTLYKEQWNTVLENSDKIRAFISANSGSLNAKE